MRNRMDERYDMTRTVRDARYRYVRNYMPHLPYGQHIQFMWEQAGYREWEQRHLDGANDAVQERFWEEKPAEELYDLRRDPDEVHNLAGDPRHAAVLDAPARCARRAHARHQRQRVHPRGLAHRGLRGQPPARRLSAARGHGARGDGDRPRPGERRCARRAPRADNEVLRYWAALGCCMLGERAAAARPALEGVLRDDASTSVRVAAAEALARLGATAESVAFLGDTLVDHPDPRVQLQAANALENIGEAARPALPALIAAQKNVDTTGGFAADQYVQQASRYTARKLSGTYFPGP